MKDKSFAEAIRDGHIDAMKKYSECVCFGLGVPDPKGIFGTTIGLQEMFGPERVFDIPLAENSITGFAIGAAALLPEPPCSTTTLIAYLGSLTGA